MEVGVEDLRGQVHQSQDQCYLMVEEAEEVKVVVLEVEKAEEV